MGTPILNWSKIPEDARATYLPPLAEEETDEELRPILTLNDTSSFLRTNSATYLDFFIDAGSDISANRVLLLIDGLTDDILYLTIYSSVNGSTFVRTGASDTPVETVGDVAKYSISLTGDDEITARYWRVTLRSFGSEIRWNLYHVALDTDKSYPHLAEDPNETDVTSTEDSIISKQGKYLGTAQYKKEHQMQINWGDLTPAEIVNVQAWADDIIKNPRQFFFMPDSDEPTTIYFGYLADGGKWSAPLDKELYITPPQTFLSRIR